MEFIEDNNLYLNILRQRQLNRLWDVNEKLYEVDIFKPNSVLETDFENILNTAGIHCYICKLEVPKIYIKEHNETLMHQNLLKITDEALERTRKHLRNTEPPNLTLKVENTYFCDICSRIVQNSEKELHEKSNFHIKCVNYNNLLSCFVDSYLNINEKKYELNFNLENDSVSENITEYIIPLSEIKEELFKNLKPKEIQALIQEKHQIENKELKIKDSKELIEKQSQELNQKSPKKIKNEILKSYFDTIQSKYPNKDYEIQYISKNQVKITALNKDVLIVPMQNFHSYSNTFCRVCLSDVLEENHKNSEDHISRIMTPIADKNGIRMVDDIWSHCIVCNELTKTVVSHNQSLNHSKNVKKYFLIQFSRSQMVQTGNLQNEKDDAKKKSEDLKVDIAPEAFIKKMDSKIESLFPIFKNVLDCENDPDQSDDFQIVGRKNKPHSSENRAADPILNDVQETKNLETQNNKSELQNVKIGAPTKPEIRVDSVQNNDASIEPKLTQYCYVCCVNVASFDNHKLLESHKIMAKENKKRSQELKKIIVRNYLFQDHNLSVTKCGLCHVNINYDKTLIETHINTEVHRKNYLKFMEDNKIILIDDQECHCEPCDQKQSRNNVFNHCSTPQHIKNLKSNPKKETTESAAQKTKKISENNTSKHTDIAKRMYNFEISAEIVLCKTCYIYIPKKESAIKKHLDSAEHCIKYKGLMTNNKIKISTDSFFCEICALCEPLGGELDHVYSNSHSETIVFKSKKKLNEQKDTKLIANKTEVVETVPKNKIIMVPLYLKQQFKKVNETDAFCKVCKKPVPYSEIRTHAEAFDHILNFSMLMMKNGIKIQEGNIFCCLFCEKTITRFNEIDHVFGKQHVKNIEGHKVIDIKLYSLHNLTFEYISTLPGCDREVAL